MKKEDAETLATAMLPSLTYISWDTELPGYCFTIHSLPKLISNKKKRNFTKTRKSFLI